MSGNMRKQLLTQERKSENEPERITILAPAQRERVRERERAGKRSVCVPPGSGRPINATERERERGQMIILIAAGIALAGTCLALLIDPINE